MKRRTINAVICKKFDEWTATIDNDEIKKLVGKNTVITGGCIASMINNEKVKDFDVYFTDLETTRKVAEYYIGKFKAAKPEGPEIKLILSSEVANKESDISKRYAAEMAKPEDDESRDKELIDFYEKAKLSMEPDRVFLFIRSVGVAAEKDIDLDDCENPLDEDIEDKEDTAKPKYRPVFFSSNAITLSDKIQLVTRFYGDADKIHENFDFCPRHQLLDQRPASGNHEAGSL
jgi:hypothetical protein